MSGNAGKLKITVDTGTLADGDSIASYLVASGTQLTATGTALDVNIGAAATTLSSILTELQSITHLEDAAHVSGDAGVMSLAVRNDAGTALAANGDYIPLSTDANGYLRTAISGAVTIAGSYAEDSAHVTGDVGLFSLSVRNDNQSTTFTGASGDYAPFATDQKGALYVKDVSNASNLQQVVTVGTTAVALPAAPLTNRTSLFVQMLSSGQLYLGSATVTNSGATRGLQLGNGGFVSLDVGPSNLVYGIANAAAKDVAVWEFA